MKNKKVLNIICIILIIQPLYDVLVYFMNDVYSLNLPFVSLIRPFLAVSLFVYLLLENKNNLKRKKIYAIYLLLFCIYCCFHLINIWGNFFELSAGSIFGEIRYLANYGYYILLLMNFDLLFRVMNDDDKKKLLTSLVYAAIIMAVLYYISVITGTSPRTYSINSIKDGWKGWSVSSHYIGHSLTFLLPIVIYTIFEKKYFYNKFRYIIIILITVPGIYLVGTKTPLFAISLIIFVYFIFKVFFEIKSDRKVSLNTLFFFFFLVIIALTFTKTFGYYNYSEQIKISQSQIESNLNLVENYIENNDDVNEDSSDIQSDESENSSSGDSSNYTYSTSDYESDFSERYEYVILNTDGLNDTVFDNRDTQKLLNSSLYALNDTFDYLFGYGYLTLPNCNWVETDTYGIFYSYGWVAFIMIIVIPFVYISISGLWCLFNIKKMNSTKFLLGFSFALCFFILTEVGYTLHFSQTVIYMVILLIISNSEFKVLTEKRNKKNYLFALNNLCVGGAEVGVIDVVNELSKKNTVDIVVLKKEGNLINKLNKDVNVIEILDSNKPYILRFIYKCMYFSSGFLTKILYRTIIKNDYDIEISYIEGYPAVFISNSSNKNSVKIASIRVGLKKHKLKAEKIPFWKKNLKKAYKKMDKVYTVSEETTKEFCDIYPEFSNKTETIYTYFNVESINKRAKEKVENVFDDGLNFLAVGRFAEQKGYERLIEAFEKIYVKNKNIKLHFLGNYDTEYGTKILNIIEEKNLNNCIRVHGIKENPYPYIKECDCLISSSYYEGFPRVINEALALDTLCIGTKVTGTIEALDNGNLGILVDDSVKGLIDGINKVINNDKCIHKLKENTKKFNGNKETFFDKFNEICTKKEELIIYMPKLSYGGMEKALVNLLNYSNLKMKYNITLVLIYKGDMNYISYLPSEIKTKILIKGKWNFINKCIASIKLLLMVFKRLFENYDVSVSYSYQHPILCFLTRISSLNSIVYIHNNLNNTFTKKQIFRFKYLCWYKGFSKIICVSNESRKGIIKFLNKDENIYYINNLIDGDSILKKSQEEVTDFDFSNKKIRFVSVSRHYDVHKKITRIISAVEKLNLENYDFEVLLIGDGEDHSMYSNLIKEKNIKNIFLLGKKENPYKYIDKSDAFLLSSAREGYPVVFIESMILNKPILTTDVSDSKKDIEGKYGFVCKNDDYSIYNIMKKYLEEGFIIAKRFDYLKHNKNISKLTEEVYKKQVSK